MTTNHPAHGPVSLERLHQIHETLSKAAAQSDGGNLGYAMADAVKVIDGAIAAFGADPVAYMHRSGQVVTREECCDDKTFAICCKVETPLYSAPPVPVVPPKIEPDYEVIKAILPTANPDFYACCVAADMWNACRAAMLQGTEPVIQPYKLPPNSFTDEDLEMMAHGNNPQSNAYRELLAFRRNFREMQNSSTNNCREISETSTNSPVTPDGWIPVSEKMPEESGRYWCYVEEQNSLGKSHYQWNCSWNGEVWSDKALTGRVTHWMPLPAPPQQEMKP